MRNIPPRNALLNATVKSVRRLFDDFLGVHATVEVPSFCERPPSGGSIAIRVAIRGAFRTSVRLVFEARLARYVAHRMMAADTHRRLAKSNWMDAALEVSNILVGNTTGALQEAGYLVTTEPPRLEVRGGLALPALTRCVVVPVFTACGSFSLMFGEVELCKTTLPYSRDGYA